MKIILSYKSKNHDEMAIKLLGYAFIFACASYGLKTLVSRIGLSVLETPVSLLVFLFYIFKTLQYYCSNYFAVKRLVLCECLYLIALAISYLLFADTRIFYSEYFYYIRQLLVVYIPCGVALSNVEKFDSFQQHLRKIALVGSFLMYLFYAMGYASRWSAQLFGVQIVPFCLILFLSYLTDGSAFDLIISIIDIVFILLGGRQSLVVAAAGFLVFFYNERGYSIRKKIAIWGIGGPILILLYFMSDYVFDILYRIFTTFGIESRTLFYLSNGTLTSFRNRELIYQRCMDFISTNGAKINGFFGDRVYLRAVASWIAYPHNIAFEFLMDFGNILGIGLLILLLIGIVRIIFTNDARRKNATLLLVILSIGRLLVSSSFMIEGMFYVMIIYVIFSPSTIKRKKICWN